MSQLSSDENNTTILKNPVAFAFLAIVLACLVASQWLLDLAMARGTNTPPPLLPFLVIGVGVVALIWGLTEGVAGSRPGSDSTPLSVTNTFSTWLALNLTGPMNDVASWRLLMLLAVWFLTGYVLNRLPDMRGDESYFLIFMAWLLAIVFYGVAIVSPDPAGWRPWLASLRATWPSNRPKITLFLAIIIIAFLFRALFLAQIPHTLGGDEGSQGLEAIKIINGQIRNPFTTGWLGVPTMSFFFNSLSIRLLGQTNEALRLPWAFLGTLTVVGLFFLARRLTNPIVAFASAALLATYHYHIHYSRLGSNQVADPLFVVFALLFLYRALDGKKALDWILTGAIAAIALYFYAGARFTPIIIIAVLGYAFLRSPRQFWREHHQGLVIMLGAFLLVGGPMIQYAARFPNDFNARLNQVGILQNGWLEREIANTGKGVVPILFDQFQRAALAFNFYPDRTVWYGLRAPLLDSFFGVIFLLGLGYGTVRMWGNGLQQRLAPMVAWYWGGVIMGGMLTESPPSSQRLITLAVPVCFFIALALWELIQLADLSLANVPVKATMALGVVAFALISLKGYFLDFSPLRLYGGPHAELATELAPLLNELSDSHYALFLGPPVMYWGFATIPYMAPQMAGQDITDVLVSPPPAELIPPGRDALFIILPTRLNELPLIQQAFPNGEYQEMYAEKSDGRLMAVLYLVSPP